MLSHKECDTHKESMNGLTYYSWSVVHTAIQRNYYMNFTTACVLKTISQNVDWNAVMNVSKMSKVLFSELIIHKVFILFRILPPFPASFWSTYINEWSHMLNVCQQYIMVTKRQRMLINQIKSVKGHMSNIALGKVDHLISDGCTHQK